MRGTFSADFRHWSYLLARPLALSVVTMVTACSDPLGLGGHDVRRMGRVSSRPAWSLDGRTIFYTDRSGSGITDIRVLALSTESGRASSLASLRGLNHAEQVRTTGDPSFVLASIAQPNWSLQLNLYQVAVAGGEVRTIASNLGTPWFAASNDGRTVAYQGSRYDSDTIYVASAVMSAGPVRFPSSGTRPRLISLSPAGTELIYESSTGLYLARADESWNSERIALSSSGEPTAMAPQVLWRNDIPQLLVAEVATTSADSVSLHTYDVTSGFRSHLSTLPRLVGSIASWQLAWSVDGLSYAVWMPVSVVDSNVERTTYRYRLYVKGPAAPSPGIALELDADEPLTWLEFSRDGRQLALLLRGSLYIVNVE